MTITKEEVQAGSKLYRRYGREVWYEATVERVTQTLVYLTDGTRIPKATLWTLSSMWFSPTPEIVKLYEAQNQVSAQVLTALAVLEKIQAAVHKASPTQLCNLVIALANVLDATKVNNS
jgi:hypothetical protein